MKNLWAPWRMEYILGQDRPQGCIFCPEKGRSFDRERLMLHIGADSLVMMNRYPYNNGHLLVAPVRHLEDPRQLTEKESADLWSTVNGSLTCLEKVMKPDGFNVGFNLGPEAGAGVAAHLHVHIVPRWAGDVNFMTVLDEVRSIPEHILSTFDRLRPAWTEAFHQDPAPEALRRS